MATVSGGSVAIDMLQPQFAYTDYYAVITGASTSTLTLRTPSGNTQILSGTFFFDASGLAPGTEITRMEEYSGGNLMYRISDMWMPLQAWSSFVLANSPTRQRHYILFGDDKIYGTSGNDRLTGLNGNDTIDGGEGFDIAAFRGNRSNFVVTRANGQLTVTDQVGSDGSDVLKNVEMLQFDDTSVIVNYVPVVNTPNYTPGHTATSVALSSTFSFSDPDGDPIMRIEIVDNTPGGGRFRRNGVLLPEQQSVSVEAAELGSYDFVTDPLAATSVSIRVSDGYGWSAWSSFVINPRANATPMITAPKLFPGKHDMVLAGPNLFSASDADGDTITKYRIYDGTVGSGGFRINGIQQAEKVEIEITAANLANLTFETDAFAESLLWVQAHDGIAWGAWKSFTVAPRANATPAVSIPQANIGTAKDAAPLALSGVLGASDADGETVTQYRFYDETAGNGRFVLNGLDQVERFGFTIAATDLTNLRFRSATSGSDVLWVQAFDGIGWGEWKSFTVSAPANIAPTVTVQNLNPGKNVTTIDGSALLTVTDPDDAGVVQYRFYDETLGNGRFQLNGVDQVERFGRVIDAADLANFRFRPGTSGSDVLWVQAFDGYAWSDWKSFTVAAPANLAPVVTITNANVTPAHGTTSIDVSTLFTTSDPDGDAIQSYEFWDSGLDAKSGRFVLNGIVQGVNVAIPVTAANLANLSFRPGIVSDQLWVRAFDGAAWSAWKSVNVAAPPNAAPVVNIANANVTPSHAFSITASSLFTTSDADNDTIQSYEFWDSGLSPNSGRFVLNGTVQGVDVAIPVLAADLNNLSFRLGTVSDQLWVRAFDGAASSAWQSVNIAPPPNAAPAVTIPNANVTPAHGLSIDASTLFSDSDADGDTIQSYEFWDSGLNASSGRFVLNGTVQGVNVAIPVAAADLANLSFRLGSVSDELWVRAFDGLNWSTWKSVNVAAPPNAVPDVTPSDSTQNANTVAALSALLSISDADNDTLSYRFWDSTPGRGTIRIGGVAQPVNANIDVMAGQLATTDFLAGSSAGTDQLWVQVFDGLAWSAWKPFTITTLA